MEESYRWWVELHGDNCSEAVRREHARWLMRSPEHIESYLRVLEHMQALQRGTVRWPSATADDLIKAARGHSVAIPLYPDTPARCEPAAETPGRARYGLIGIAASLLLAVAVAWWMARPEVYQTRIGEQRSVVLEDGSLVTLNTASAVAVDFHRRRRSIELLRGEAMFQVAHDASRPFDVMNGSDVVRAVGTEFNVRAVDAGTVVTVIEGQVEVRAEPHDVHMPASGTRMQLVSASEQVTVRDHAVSQPRRIEDMNRVTGWLQRRIVFDREPLGHIANELNRYARTKILIQDARLYRREISGVFRTDDQAAFVRFLSNVPGVEMRQSSTGDLVVTLKATQRASGQTAGVAGGQNASDAVYSRQSHPFTSHSTGNG